MSILIIDKCFILSAQIIWDCLGMQLSSYYKQLNMICPWSDQMVCLEITVQMISDQVAMINCPCLSRVLGLCSKFYDLLFRNFPCETQICTGHTLTSARYWLQGVHSRTLLLSLFVHCPTVWTPEGPMKQGNWDCKSTNTSIGFSLFLLPSISFSIPVPSCKLSTSANLIPVWSTSLCACLETSNEISLLLLVNQVQCHLQTNGLHVRLP